MPHVTFPYLASTVGFFIMVTTFVAPVLDRIHRLETNSEVLNVKLSNIETNTSKLSQAYEQLAAQERRRGPGTTP